MPIHAACPHCAKSIKAPDHLAGKSGKCPSCGGVVPIPPPKPFDPLSVLDDGTREPSEEARGKISTRAETAACPYCGGEIVPDMRKCRHCGEFLATGPSIPPLLRGKMICADCGSHVDGRRAIQGSFLIELCLWIFMLLPGILYSIWRLTTRHRACEKCGSRNLVPADSPRGKDLAMRFNRG